MMVVELVCAHTFDIGHFFISFLYLLLLAIEETSEGTTGNLFTILESFFFHQIDILFYFI